MISSNAAVLLAPLFALVVVAVTGTFVMWRIHHHGRVFNWPALPDKPRAPPVTRHGDK